MAPSLIPTLWNIGILLQKQATLGKHFGPECISILETKEWTILKNKGTLVMSILKVGILVAPLFFINSYSLVPKVEICLKYILFGQKSQKAAIMNWWVDYAHHMILLSLLDLKLFRRSCLYTLTWIFQVMNWENLTQYAKKLLEIL